MTAAFGFDDDRRAAQYDTRRRYWLRLQQHGVLLVHGLQLSHLECAASRASNATSDLGMVLRNMDPEVLDDALGPQT